MERGVPPPDWIANQTEGESLDSFYLRAFYDLSTERQLGFTVGPIPVTSIYTYASVNGLPSYMMELFEAVIRGMDRTYLKWAEDTRKKASKRGVAPTHIGDTKEKK